MEKTFAREIYKRVVVGKKYSTRETVEMVNDAYKCFTFNSGNIYTNT